MATGISIGKCKLCNATFSKKAMTKHLESCVQRKEAGEASSASEKEKSKKMDVFHLVVEGRDLPDYWMHLSAPAHATLKDLDNFLRGIWLECCGHLSAFTIEGTRYSSYPEKEYDERGMKDVMGDVIDAGMKFCHEYDFGSTTELTLKVVSKNESEVKNKSIRILARNEAPSIGCVKCGKPATQICTECVYTGEGLFCDECAGGHECGEEMILPVVNSSRVGVCGYTG